jgi:hypothetical protein
MQMTKLLKLLCLTFFLFSCEQKQDTKFYWVRFKGDSKIADTNQILHIDKSQVEDTTKIAYISKIDTITYLLRIHNRDSSVISGSYNDREYLRHLFDTTVILGKDTFAITKYILNEFAIDGSSIHYYSSGLGIYAVHSGTWPGIILLQSSDSTINKEIKKLINITVPKFFIRGTLGNELQ